MRRANLLFILICAAAVSPAQEKIRPKPTAATEACGRFVSWRSDFESALAEAKASQRPIFVYLPRIEGSPMDRQREVDLAFRAGPLSEPEVIALLNERFIPVRGTPPAEMIQRFQLRPREFIEPGYLILTAAGELLERRDQVTTLHRDWLPMRLRRAISAEVPHRVKERTIEEEVRYLLSKGDTHRALAAIDAAVRKSAGEDGRKPLDLDELRWLRGAALWFSGQHAAAKALFESMAGEANPWTTRAAAEAQGFGPIVRGLMTFRAVPAKRLLHDASPGTNVPRQRSEEVDLIREALAVLLDLQAEDGGYQDSIYDYGGTASLPNVYVAVTALAGLAMQRQSRHPALARDAELLGRLQAAIDRALRYVLNQQHLALEDPNELVWAHIYRLWFLHARWQDAEGPQRKELATSIKAIAKALFEAQLPDGSWRHEYPNPFVTAAALRALELAAEAGAVVPKSAIEKGGALLARCRAEDGTFSYALPRGGRGGARIEGAAGRMPVCEHGLLIAGRSDAQRLIRALSAAAEHEPKLGLVRKYDDHADAFGNGGFFYWFDLLHRNEAIMVLEDGPARRAAREALLDLVVSLPEFDGSFVDSHEVGRAYGTAMALAILAPIPARP